MNVIGFFTLAAVGSLLAFSAEAGPKGQHGNSGHGHAKHDTELHCPPGLAKKDPPCIPPGQAATPDAVPDAPVVDQPAVELTGYQPGDILPDDYVILVNPHIYNPDLDVIYVRYGDYLYLIDRETAEVMARLGNISEWNWAWDGTDPADTAGCPPGLAKKDPPCIPPGLADQNAAEAVQDDPYGIGETLPPDYTVTIDPKLYAPNDAGQYVREGDTIYRADGTTGAVLDQVGPIMGKVIE